MVSRKTSRFLVLTVFGFVAVLVFDGRIASSAGKSPSAPTYLTVTGVTESTIAVSWNSSMHNRRFTYRVRIVNQKSPHNYSLATVGQTETSYTARFLSPGDTYSLTVYAVDDRGNRSADSNTVSARTTPDETPPSAPTLLTTVLGPSQVRLDWTRSTDNIPLNCCSYLIFMNDVRVTQHINWYAETSVIIRHLTPASTNAFKITATDYRGNTSESNSSVVMTDPSTDTVAPTAPANLHLIRDQGCAEVTLGWTQSTDDMDPQFAIEYEIYVNGVLSPLAVSAGVSEDFVYGTAFGENVFVVKAVDRTGNTSAASAPLTLQLWPC
jgi:predicted phage tail protein